MKEKIKRITKIVISALLMLFLLRQIDFSELQCIIYELNPHIIIIAVAIYLFSVMLNGVKWHVLLPNTRLSFLVFLSFRSQLYATILPGQLFGEASKITLWKDEEEDLMRVTASVVFDKITSLIGQVLLAIIGFSFSDVGKTLNGSKIFAMIGMIFVILILLSSETHVSNMIGMILSFLKVRSKKIGEKSEDLYNAWKQFSLDKAVLVKSIYWGMLNQFVGIVMIWYVSTNMGIFVGVIDYCWIMPMLSFVLLIPISFAGIGLRDASLASMLSLYDVTTGKVVVISSMLLLGQVTAAMVGGIMVVISNLRIKNSKQ